MSKTRTKKITATEMLRNPGCLRPEPKRGGYRYSVQIKKVTLRSGSYYLQFERGYSMLHLAPSQIRTIAATFGDDCDDWRGAIVTLVESFSVKLLIKKNKNGMPVMSEH